MESEISMTTVRNLLVEMQSEEVSAAEKTLRSMTTHPQFFQWIYIIMSNPQQLDWVKTIAASFINSFFSEHINEQNWDSICEAIIKILQEPCIKQLDKRIFQKSIIKSIEVGTLANRSKWVRTIYEFLNNINNYDTAFLILACLAASDISPSILYDVIKDSYNRILSSLEVNVANANLLNEMIKMWIVVLDTMKIEDVPNWTIITQMIGSPYMLALISAVYELESEPNMIVCMKEGLEELNFLKYQVADFHKRMLTIELEHSDEAFSSVIQFTRQYLSKIGSTLFYMAPNRQLIQSKGCDDLMVTLLAVLRLYLNIKPEQFKFEDVKSMINQIVFPLLQVYDDERNTFEESPEEFNSLAEDCCDKQTFEILKTEAAKLLQKIGDKIEGGAQYAIMRAVQSLKATFGGFTLNQELGQVQILEIQTSFLIASIFSYAISSYPEQTMTLKLLLDDERAKNQPPLELARIFIFLGYNYNQIYKEPSEGEHWLRFVLGYNRHPTTVYCALDFLSNIVDQYFSEPLIDSLTDLIQTGSLGLIWDISSKIIQKHYQSLSGNAIGILISKVFTRIEKEVRGLDNKQTESTLDLINCLRIFCNILKQARKEEVGYEATVVKKEFLMTKIWPILDFYPISVKYQVEDEVTKVATEMINTMEFIVPEFSKYLQQFLQAFKLNKYSEKVLLKLMNQYLIKADFQRNTNEIILILISLKEALLHLLGSLTDQKGKMKGLPYLRATFGNTILVVQNSIAKYGIDLLKSNNIDYFHEISSICIRLIPFTIEAFEKTSSSRIIYSRIFNTLFLCHMHIPITEILNIFTLFQSQRIYHGYDTKVLTLCIEKQITKQTDISVIVTLLSGLIKIIVLSTEKEEKIEKKKSKKNQNKINTNIKTIEEFDKILKTIDSPFKQSKQLPEILSNLFYTMKTTRQQLFNEVLQYLPHEDFNSFQKFIEFEHLQRKIRKIVKVVDIKRSEIQVEAYKQSTEMKDSDQETDGPKRQRMREKAEKKEKKNVKKRQHKEEYH